MAVKGLTKEAEENIRLMMDDIKQQAASQTNHWEDMRLDRESGIRKQVGASIAKAVSEASKLPRGQGMTPMIAGMLPESFDVGSAIGSPPPRLF